MTAFSLIGQSASMFMFEVNNIVNWWIVNIYKPFCSLNFDSLPHVYSEDGDTVLLWVTGTIYHIIWNNQEGHSPKENILLFLLYAG